MSHPRLIAAAALAAAALSATAGSAPAASLPAGTTAILSGTPSLFEALPQPVGDAGSSSRAVSDDGRYITFNATSDGLVDDDDDRARQVYRKDMQTGDVVLVSRRDGVAGESAHASCHDSAISDDGLRVAFVCLGPLTDTDTNGARDVYVRDVAAGTTTLASRVTATGAAGEGASFSPVLDQDGSAVVFASSAVDLADAAPGPGRIGVYRHDLSAGKTVLVTRRDGALGAPAAGGDPSVTDDGDVVAFATEDALDATADTNGTTDVYVREISTGRTILASRAATATGAGGDRHSASPHISGNGLAVVFESAATNFDGRDKDGSMSIYRRGLAFPTTTLVDVTAGGVRGGAAWDPSIDDSGAVVAFVSDTTVLDPADKDAAQDAYVAKLATGSVAVASRADGASGAPANRQAESAAVSGDGTHVVANLRAGGITPDAEPRRETVIRRSLTSSATRSVARPGGSEPFVNSGGAAEDAVLSADGRYAAFRAESPGLGLPANAARGIFLRDRVTGGLALVSREDGPAGAVFSDASKPAISADGRRVAFAAPPAPGEPRQVYVREPATGRTWTATLDGPGKAQLADGRSGSVTLDADGSRVAFRSSATNLSPDDKDAIDDVFVRDLETGQTFLVSRAEGAAGAKGDGPSRGPDIDASGTRVSFTSTAKNLTPADTDPSRDVFLRDLAGTTRLVSATPAGVKGVDDTGTETSIDASGTRVAFDSTADELTGPSNTKHALVRDFTANRLDVVGAGGGAKISPDGGFVAFSGWHGAALLRDLGGARTVIVSRHAREDATGGTPVATVSDVSSNGGCVAFATTDPIVGTERERHDAYVRAVLANCGDVPAPGHGTGGPAEPSTPAAGAGTPDGAVGPLRGSRAEDTVAPVLSRVRLGSKRLRRGKATTLRFVASEAGRLSVTIERPARRGARGRRRARRVGALRTPIARGAGRVIIATRIGRKSLSRGRYRVIVTATDAAGNRSRPVRVAFTVR